MKKLLLLASMVVPALAFAASPTTVYVRGNVADLPPAVTKDANYTFASIADAGFVAPKIIKFARLVIPESIKLETKPHSVDVGVVLDDTGSVLKVCVVKSNCRDLEKPAITWVKALKFAPASLNGSRSCAYIIVPVEYSFSPSQS